SSGRRAGQSACRAIYSLAKISDSRLPCRGSAFPSPRSCRLSLMDQPDIIDLMIFGIVRGFFSLPVIVLAATPVFIASRLSKDVRWRQRLAWPLALACTMVAMIVDAVLGNNPLDFSLVLYGLWAW